MCNSKRYRMQAPEQLLRYPSPIRTSTWLRQTLHISVRRVCSDIRDRFTIDQQNAKRGTIGRRKHLYSWHAIPRSGRGPRARKERGQPAADHASAEVRDTSDEVGDPECVFSSQCSMSQVLF